MLATRSASLPLTVIGHLPLTPEADDTRRWSRGRRSQWRQTIETEKVSLQRILFFVVSIPYATRHTLHCAQRGSAVRRRSTGNDTLVLIDGSFCLYQSFHATVGRKLQNQCVEPTLAIHVFRRQLDKFLRVLQPSHFAVMFDEETSSLLRRRDLPTYKCHRKCPHELIPQFAKARDVCDALQWPCASHRDFEADDLIATFARDAAKNHCHVSIVSADKDLTQLASPFIHIHNNPQNPQDNMNHEGVRARWGVRPEQMVDLLALVGDVADAVPGVPGIGKVKAAALLNQYKNLDEILAAATAGTIKVRGIGPKLLSMLREHGERAKQMRKIVKLQSIPDSPKFNAAKWRKDFKVRKRDDSWHEEERTSAEQHLQQKQGWWRRWWLQVRPAKLTVPCGRGLCNMH